MTEDLIQLKQFKNWTTNILQIRKLKSTSDPKGKASCDRIEGKDIFASLQSTFHSFREKLK